MKKNRVGIILEVGINHTVVITEESNIITVATKEGMAEGQLIFLDALQESNRRKINKAAVSVAGIAAALIMIVFSYLFLGVSHQPYIYLDVDINPSMELMMDNEYKILHLAPLNSDAVKLVNGLEYKNKNAKEVLVSIFQKSKALGYIKENQKNLILFSSALTGQTSLEEDRRLNTLLSDAKNTALQNIKDNIEIRTLKANTQIREKALKKDLSMGRFVILKEAEKKGVSLSESDAKKDSLATLLDRIGDIPENVLIDKANNETKGEGIKSNGKQPGKDHGNGKNNSDNLENDIRVHVSPAPVSMASPSTATSQTLRPTPTPIITSTPILQPLSTTVATAAMSSTPVCTLLPTSTPVVPIIIELPSAAPLDKIIVPGPPTFIPKQTPQCPQQHTPQQKQNQKGKGQNKAEEKGSNAQNGRPENLPAPEDS